MSWRVVLVLGLVGCSREHAPDSGTVPPVGDSAWPGDSTVPVDSTTETGDTAPPELRWVGVTSGFAVNCATRSDGSATCWGSELYLGEHVPRPGPYTKIVIGDVAACGLRPDGSVDCWGCETGFEDWKLCGERPGPYVDIERGTYSACGQFADGTWECWGLADNKKPYDPPPPVPFVEFDMALYVICGLTAPGSEPSCWGEAPYPEQFPPFGLSLTKLAGGFVHTCALDAEGMPICWGLSNRLEPYPPPPAEPFVAIDSHDQLTCAQRADGTASCWGPPHLDGFGIEAPEGVVFDHVSVGNDHACGLTVEGEILCWGVERIAGQLDPPEL